MTKKRSNTHLRRQLQCAHDRAVALQRQTDQAGPLLEDIRLTREGLGEKFAYSESEDFSHLSEQQQVAYVDTMKEDMAALHCRVDELGGILGLNFQPDDSPERRMKLIIGALDSGNHRIGS
jgi:hypothetical protein